MNAGSTILIALAAVITMSLGLVAWLWWKRDARVRDEGALRAELARREQLLRDAAVLRPAGEVWARSTGQGQIALLAVGSYAAAQLPSILTQFERAGAADHIGIVYLLELDLDARDTCLRDVPQVFRERMVEASSSLLPGGGGGDPPQDVLDADELWKRGVMEQARLWLSRIQRETKPVVLLCLLSPGGMAPMGLPVLQEFHERYPKLPIYVTSILDHKPVVRRRFPEIRQLYCEEGLVRGFIVTDNLRSSRRSDLGIATLFAAMVGATWVADLPLQLWNGAAYVFPKQARPSYATIRVWAENLPVYRLPPWRKALPEVFYTDRDLAEEKATRGVRTAIERNEFQALPLDSVQRGRTRLSYVVAPIAPEPDFKALAERIDIDLKGWRERTDPDLLIQYASIGAPMDPSTREVPMVVVALEPLEDDGTEIDALAEGTHPIDDKFYPRNFAKGRAHRNGSGPDDARGAPRDEEVPA